MTMQRPARETKPEIQSDYADERCRTDRDRASHLLPRRWRPQKRDVPALGSVAGLGDVTCERAEKFRVF